VSSRPDLIPERAREGYCTGLDFSRQEETHRSKEMVAAEKGDYHVAVTLRIAFGPADKNVIRGPCMNDRTPRRAAAATKSMKMKTSKSGTAEVFDLGLIKSVGKALTVLQELYHAGRPLRVIDLANSLQTSPSTISRLVSTLAGAGLVEQEADTGRCYLGFGLALLGNATLGRRELDLIALPVMAELSAEFNEYISLSRLHQWKVIIMRGRTLDTIRRDITMMSVVPVHGSAPGKVLAAWQDPSYVRQMLAQHGMDALTSRTITTIDAFMEELERIRKAGFALDDQELIQGLRHVAAPVYDHRGDVVATISAGGSARRVDGEELEKLTAATIRCAADVSRQLGFRHSSLGR
jgi:DNA-binding IclR family transcriptional regulator